MELVNVNLKREMYENEINQKLKNVTGYLGSFAIDELETLRISHYPSYIIINLDKRADEGSHWIGVAMFLNHVYVCDSLGTLLPTNVFPQLLVNFLYRASFRKTLHITKQLQAVTSTTCGLYCIYFVKCMCNSSFHDFISSFKYNDFVLNDLIIALYAKNF